MPCADGIRAWWTAVRSWRAGKAASRLILLSEVLYQAVLYKERCV